MTIPTAAANVGVGLDTLAPLRHPALHPGAVLARTPTCAADLRAELRATGTPDLVDTCDLVTSPSPRDSRFPQFFPSSVLTRRWTNPGTAPTFVHERITHRATPEHRAEDRP